MSLAAWPRRSVRPHDVAIQSLLCGNSIILLISSQYTGLEEAVLGQRVWIRGDWWRDHQQGAFVVRLQHTNRQVDLRHQQRQEYDVGGM